VPAEFAFVKVDDAASFCKSRWLVRGIQIGNQGIANAACGSHQQVPAIKMLLEINFHALGIQQGKSGAYISVRMAQKGNFDG
jgi:hypothetical protein